MWDMKSGYLVEWQVKKQQNSRPNNLILNDEIEKKNQFKKKTTKKKTVSTWINSTSLPPMK
jgi:hypothetical protein